MRQAESRIPRPGRAPCGCLSPRSR